MDVTTSHRHFIPLGSENELDNEPCSINGDSVQLYARSGTTSVGALLVPNAEGRSADAQGIDGWANTMSVVASWEPSARGYRLTAVLAIEPHADDMWLDVIVNEAAPGRARRRGQLVLSGAAGEFVYLRGDRHEPVRLLRFLLRP